MSAPSPPAWHIEDYRPYLRELAELCVAPQLRSKIDASDLVQQTLLKAHQHRAGFRGQSEPELRGWLRRILTSLVSDARRFFSARTRCAWRECPLPTGPSGVGPTVAAAIESPSGALQAQEQMAAVWHALDGLPEDQRRVVIWRYVHGLTVEEIGRRLGRGERAVAGLLRRGLQGLRAELGRSQGASHDEPAPARD